MNISSYALSLAVATHLGMHFREPQTAIQGALVITLLPLAVVIALYEVGYSSGSFSGDCLWFYASYLCMLSLSVISYRLSPLHPLHDIPGPTFSKITKLLSIWQAYTGKYYLELHGLHEKYGPIVRTGPNDISIVDIKAIGEVLGSSGVPKGKSYVHRQDHRNPGPLICLNGDAHTSRRKIWNRGMSSESLYEYEESMSERVRELVHKLGQLADEGSVVDIGKWISYFSFDMMGDMAFGGGFDMMRDGDKDGIWRDMSVFNIVVHMACQVPWLSSTLTLLPFRARDNFRDWARRNAMRRAGQVPEKKDLWYHLMDEAGLEKVKRPVTEVAKDAGLAVIAGSDTSSTVMSSLVFLILGNPDVYKKLQAEIDETFPGGTDPTDSTKLSSMPYLDACISEALRLFPPLLVAGPRQIPYDENGRYIAGRFIPSGTEISLPHYSYHRNPEFFSPSTDEFIPDRWLDQSEKYNTNRTAFIPFSYGPANCVGKQFALLEMRMVAASLFQTLEFSLAEGYDPSKWASDLRDYFVAMKGQLPVRIGRRPARR